MNFKTTRNKRPSESTYRNYKMAFGWCEPLHSKKFANIRIGDLQLIADKYKVKSESTVTTIKTVLNQMYLYAVKKEIVDKNYAAMTDWEWIESEEKAHEPFTDEEINILWNNINIQDVDLILMMIYTGFRASEFIGLENLNIYLDNKYVIGGMKTEAGTDRTVALNNKILPLFEKRRSGERYFVLNENGKKYSYGTFYIEVWTRLMKHFGMNHSPHDTRHTFASLLDRAGANKVCIKLLMGHSIQDITDGVYTHKTLDDLLEAVNLI
jgi:integrase